MSVHTFYQNGIEKLVAKFPFDEPLLSRTQFLDASARREVSSADIMSPIQRFPQIFVIEIHDLLLCQNPKGTDCFLVFLEGISNDHNMMADGECTW